MTEWQDLERSAILVVDDDEGLRTAIARHLAGLDFTVETAASVHEAREVLARRIVLLVVTDISMPSGPSGLDLLHEIREREPGLDVVMMTGQTDVDSAIQALKDGAYDYLRKPFPLEALAAVVVNAVESRRLRVRTALFERLEERRITERENYHQFLLSLASVIDAKSGYTARHSARVSDLSRLLAERLGLAAAEVERIALGARLHDIGKIGVPDAIIDKPGPLTSEEFAVMKTHPDVGDELLAPIRSMQPLRPMVRWHHESLDGQGYPDALAGEQVPEEAFIVKIADYWEAITARRPYRDPMPLPVAVRTLRAEAGVRIPAELVETFLEAIQGAPIALPSA